MEILIIIFLILLNGVFAMSEIALVSARKFKLENAAKRGNSNARKALDLANNPTRFLSTVQVGITLIGILTGIFSGEEITDRLEASLGRLQAVKPYANSLAVLIVVIVVTFFSIVFGELIPKRIGLLFPEKIAAFMAKPMRLVSLIASPFIWLLTNTNDLFLKLFGIKNTGDDKVTEEEIKAIVQQSAATGEIQLIEHNIVQRVFALGDRRVEELMTHRTDIAWLDITAGLEDVRKTVQNELHSIYPVAEGSLDKLKGIVNVKEIFAANATADNFRLSDYIHKPLVVFSNTAAYRVLDDFRKAKWHHAIVVDEYGAVEGIISMSDVLEALVGSVSQFEVTTQQLMKRDENSWFADGDLPFFELVQYFGIEEEGEEFNTIAGLVLDKMGKIPSAGDKIVWKDLEIEVLDMDGYKIDKVLISKSQIV